MGFTRSIVFPIVWVALMGYHIAIVTPYDNYPEDPPIGYKNRKGNYTINTQLICVASLKLLNVNARYPGSTHDQHIFNNSNVKLEMARLVSERIGEYYLIGDSEYAKEEFMLTPILPAPSENTREHLYNKKITKVRNCIERTNGVLKSIFRCLRKDRVLHYQPEAASFIINACCVIYNMMHHYRFPLPDPEGDEEDVDYAAAIQQNDAHEVTMQRSRIAALQRQEAMITYISNI